MEEGKEATSQLYNGKNQNMQLGESILNKQVSEITGSVTDNFWLA